MSYKEHSKGIIIMLPDKKFIMLGITLQGILPVDICEDTDGDITIEDIFNTTSMNSITIPENQLIELHREELEEEYNIQTLHQCIEYDKMQDITEEAYTMHT